VCVIRVCTFISDLSLASVCPCLWGSVVEGSSTCINLKYFILEKVRIYIYTTRKMGEKVRMAMCMCVSVCVACGIIVLENTRAKLSSVAPPVFHNK
jgi:hypothetical protein